MAAFNILEFYNGAREDQQVVFKVSVHTTFVAMFFDLSYNLHSFS